MNGTCLFWQVRHDPSQKTFNGLIVIKIHKSDTSTTAKLWELESWLVFYHSIKVIDSFVRPRQHLFFAVNKPYFSSVDSFHFSGVQYFYTTYNLLFNIFAKQTYFDTSCK
jgi:hypothetical protein